MRGERLQQAKRHARRVLRVWRAANAGLARERWYDENGLLEQGMRYTRVRCSGPCCGNPRRHYGQRTLQERKANEATAAQLMEAGL